MNFPFISLNLFRYHYYYHHDDDDDDDDALMVVDAHKYGFPCYLNDGLVFFPKRSIGLAFILYILDSETNAFT